MENIIQEQITIDKKQDKSDNDIINALDSYLNGRTEKMRDDYEEVNAYNLPDPVLKENGMWNIPGTTREFKTPAAAQLAKQRYTEYLIQNQASMLMYGVTYDDYVHGVEKNDESDKETGQSETDAGPTDNPTTTTTNDTVPETPADYT